jgi:hypothetical protein
MRSCYSKPILDWCPPCTNNPICKLNRPEPNTCSRSISAPLVHHTTSPTTFPTKPILSGVQLVPCKQYAPSRVTQTAPGAGSTVPFSSQAPYSPANSPPASSCPTFSPPAPPTISAAPSLKPSQIPNERVLRQRRDETPGPGSTSSSTNTPLLLL